VFFFFVLRSRNTRALYVKVYVKDIFKIGKKHRERQTRTGPMLIYITLGGVRGVTIETELASNEDIRKSMGKKR
jgi:hypothetical protein